MKQKYSVLPDGEIKIAMNGVSIKEAMDKSFELKRKNGFAEMDFHTLKEEERQKILRSGAEYMNNHLDHVTRLIHTAEFSVIPSGSDIHHPELWKPMHWKWFGDVAHWLGRE